MITYTYHILAIYARHNKCTEFPDETSPRVTKITFYFLFLPKDLTTAKNINIRIFSTAIDFHYIQSLQLLTFRSHTP